MTKLFYFHDPMCSWCYAFDKNLELIEASLPDSIRLLKIMGGLAADTDEPMPTHLRCSIQSTWKQIEKTVPHIQFNFEFWIKNQAFRSTYPSCRAVLAAKKQASFFENKMIKQIQRAYYQNAENPSLDETLFLCAQRIGLDMTVFKKDFSGQMIEDELQKEIQFTKHMKVSSYPSLRLEIGQQITSVTIDYNNVQNTLKQII